MEQVEIQERKLYDMASYQTDIYKENLFID